MSWTFARCRARAGISAMKTPVAATMTSVTVRTVRSVDSARRGAAYGYTRIMVARPQRAMASAPSPPMTQDATLSRSSCRSTRPRPAPTDTRTAISLLRADIRASSRSATLVHATRSTKPTPASRTVNPRRTFRTIRSARGATRTEPRRRALSGARAYIAESSAAAPCTAIPGLTRPTRLNNCRNCPFGFGTANERTRSMSLS